VKYLSTFPRRGGISKIIRTLEQYRTFLTNQ
jgi:hypothetical protein